MLAVGSIDVRRARVLTDGTSHLEQSAARRVIADIADRPPQLTTGQLRALLKRRCLESEPKDTTQRFHHAVEQRRMVVTATGNGTADLCLLDLSPDQAVAAQERIERYARNQPDDGRTMDQRRADAAIDILCGQGDPAPTGTVDITVDLRTLLHVADTPAELAGWGPVVADIARQVVDKHRDGRWQATVIDDNGDPYAVALRRRPTASQQRQIRARHRTCVFPGCRKPARRSDLDHTTRWVDGGTTLQRNLGPLCRVHHRAKDEGRWRYRRAANGDHIWTSPLGNTYTTSARSP